MTKKNSLGVFRDQGVMKRGKVKKIRFWDRLPYVSECESKSVKNVIMLDKIKFC